MEIFVIRLSSVVAAFFLLFSTNIASASDGMNKFIDLYQELLSFKDSKEFRDVGYGQCCIYSEWANRVKEFDRKESMEVLRAVEVVPMDLWTIGKDHFSRNEKVRESAAERLVVIGQFIKIYKSDEVAESGEGTMVMTDPACTDYSVFEEFADYMLDQKYAEAGDFLDEAIERGECRRILSGTIVSGPHDEKDGKLGDLVQIEISNGTKLWTLDSNVEFE